MKASSSSDTSENPKIESNLFLQLQNCDDTLVAGIKVVDTCGGPEMTLLGFVSSTPNTIDYDVIADRIVFTKGLKAADY
ncbi:MAG: hypothetical protein HOG05_12830 [Bacteroidetes bacterium]|jgi:hypothetical protein|nr:hypothetical protein [Bacteroidota bacterium]